MVEYLEKVQSLYNTDKYTVLEITTDKNTYTAKFPYIKKQKYNHEDSFLYSINIMDWCELRKIMIKDYFNFKHRRLIDS